MSRPQPQPRTQLARLWLLAVAALTALTLACGGGDGNNDSAQSSPAVTGTAATAAATTTGPNPFEGIAGIVDPKNHGWPREVEGLNGKVTIKEKPKRVHTMSAGLDEITIALLPVSRIAGVGSATKNPDTSSMSDTVKNLPTVAREPEAVVSVNPDLVLASPSQKADVIAALERLKITVVQLDLDPTPKGRIDTIMLLGYIYGEEERAQQLATEVQKRYDAVVSVTSRKPEAQRPVVLSTTKYSSISIGGKNTTGEGIVVAAGGINAGTKIGMEGNQTASVEAMVKANPDYIILPMAKDIGEAFKAELIGNAALAETPAVKNNRVIVVPPQIYTTNSFANIRAAEHLAHILWPADFPAAETVQFSLPSGQ